MKQTVTNLAVLIAAVCRSDIVQAQKLQQVRVALSTPTPPMAPLSIAKDKKIYEKYGLDVQVILVNSGSLAAQMFQAGEIQITANAPVSLVTLAGGGKPKRSSTSAAQAFGQRKFLTLCIAKIVSGTFAAKRCPELDTRSDHFRPPWITKWALLVISSATKNPW